MKLDIGTFGSSTPSHFLVDYLNQLQDKYLNSRISAVFQNYNRNLKTTVQCELPRNLKLRLINVLFDEKEIWANETLKEYPKLLTYVLNILSAKKRNAMKEAQ